MTGNGLLNTMTRPLRLEFKGALYHITSRGDRREAIFESDVDRIGFLRRLGEVCDSYNWACHAYCLMGNHYHLMVETPDANLSKGMRQLNGVYTQDFNRRHGRCGHVFQGRFKSILVDKQAYLLELSRYIVLNPVRAGMVKNPEDWHWSSYRAMIGLSIGPTWFNSDWLLSVFGKRSVSAKKRYSKFVLAGVGRESIWSALKHQVYLGDDQFVERMQSLIHEDRDLSEMPKVQSRPPTKPIAEYLDQEKDRNRAIASAYRSGGYTLAEIAAFFNLHYSTVSIIVRNSKSKT